MSNTYDVATNCVTGWWESGVPHFDFYEVGAELYEYDAWTGIGALVSGDIEFVFHP